MKTIQVNTDILENKIQKLEKLKVQCNAVNVSAKSVQGSGTSIDAVQDMDNAYAVVKERLYTLLSNSILMFENIRESMLEADRSAAGDRN